MSSVRVVFVELDGTPEMVQQVISQFVDRASTRERILPPASPEPPEPKQIVEAEPSPSLTLRSPELQQEPPAKRQSPAKRAKKEPLKFKFRPGSKPSAPAAPPSSGMPSPAQDAVRAALAKSPLTTRDLIAALSSDIKAGKIAVASIYATLTVMRQKGLVETRQDEVDGQRKNYLVQ